MAVFTIPDPAETPYFSASVPTGAGVVTCISDGKTGAALKSRGARESRVVGSTAEYLAIASCVIDRSLGCIGPISLMEGITVCPADSIAPWFTGVSESIVTPLGFNASPPVPTEKFFGSNGALTAEGSPTVEERLLVASILPPTSFSVVPLTVSIPTLGVS